MLLQGRRSAFAVLQYHMDTATLQLTSGFDVRLGRLRRGSDKRMVKHTKALRTFSTYMRNTDWKAQPYVRNRVDSEAAHSDTVTPKTEIDAFKKWRAFYVVPQCHA